MPLVSSGRTFPSISSVVDAREGHQSSTEMILTPWDLWMAAIVVLAVCYETRPRFRYWTRFSMYFGVTMCIAILFIPVAMLRPKNVHNTVVVAYLLGPLLNALLGTKIYLRNPENFVEDGSILVANHQSALDFQGMITIWPVMKRCAAIAKKEINYAGPFGFVAWLCGTIFIERRDPEKARVAMNEAIEVVKQKKLKLWIFPEGTRSSGDEMLPFKKGAFHLAITSQLPVSPVVFSRYLHVDHKQQRFETGEVIITVLPPISTEGMTLQQLPELMEQVRRAMMETYVSITSEVRSTAQLTQS